MTPKNIAFAFAIIQFFIIVFYDKFEFLQKYPKMYEDALGAAFFMAFLFLWQMEINK